MIVVDAIDESRNRKLSFLTAYVGFLLLITAFAHASASAQGGPPMITDDTETVEPHHWEINTAFTIERAADGSLFGAPLLDVNYGLTSHTQLKVEIPWLLLHQNGQRGVSGIGNTNIGVRWRFRDETDKQRVAVSMYPQIEFNNPGPSVRRGLVGNGPEFLMPLQWQTKLGKFALGGDVGYRFKRGPDELIYGVILGRDFGGFELMGEIHGTGERPHLGTSQIVFNIGSRAKLTKHSVLLLSAGRSLRPGHDPQFIGYAGIQLNF
ncbi:MAG: hypothetical protein ACR2IH_11955 [Pyrinomonadaceae bacterium]